MYERHGGVEGRLCVCVRVCMRACVHVCDSPLTPSLPWCHLKMASKCAQFETLQPFSFSHWHVKRFSLKRIALKADVLKDWKIYCAQAQLCIYQPGNFTG